MPASAARAVAPVAASSDHRGARPVGRRGAGRAGSENRGGRGGGLRQPRGGDRPGSPSLRRARVHDVSSSGPYSAGAQSSIRLRRPSSRDRRRSRRWGRRNAGARPRRSGASHRLARTYARLRQEAACQHQQQDRSLSHVAHCKPAPSAAFPLHWPLMSAFDVVGVGLNATDTMIVVPRFPPMPAKSRSRRRSSASAARSPAPSSPVGSSD